MKIIKFTFQIIVLGILFTLVSFAQNENSSKKIDIKTGNDKVYKNKYFKFSIDKIINWNEVSNDDSAMIVEFAKQADSKLNDKAKKELEKSVKETQFLFHYSKNPIGMLDNASFIIAAEYSENNGAHMKLIANASQENFEKNMGYEIIKNAHSVSIGGKTFYLIEAKKSLSGRTVFQKIYMQRFDQYILQIVLSYKNVEELKVMESTLQTLKFDK